MRQLAALVRAGLPLLRSLEILIAQEKDTGFGRVLRALAAEVRSGDAFSDALMRHPESFDALFVHMVKAGEVGGTLSRTLTYLSRFLERSLRMRSQICSALLYPMVVIVISVAVILFLTLGVVPKFQMLFEDMLKGASLPGPTAWVMGLSEFLRDHLRWALLGVVAVGVGFAYGWRTVNGRKLADWVWLHLPGVSSLVRKASVARFSRVVGLLLANGVPLLSALEVARDTLSNFYFRKAIDRLWGRLREGESLGAGMGCEPLFPYAVSCMIGVGEETGDLAAMFDYVAEDYEDAVEQAGRGLTALLEPLMIVMLAVVIGSVVIALFLPIIQIITQLQ